MKSIHGPWFSVVVFYTITLSLIKLLVYTINIAVLIILIVQNIFLIGFAHKHETLRQCWHKVGPAS